MSASIEVIDIPASGPLDPVTVFLQDLGDKRGQMTVISFGMAWTMYLGAMGSNSVKSFISTCGSDYIANKLYCYQRQCSKKIEKHELSRLVQIANAIKFALTMQTTANLAEEG